MIKSIIKESFIMLLLIIAIILVLGIILYDYNPGTQIIPSEVAEYTLPQGMQEELDATIKEAEKQNIIKTYKVDSSDLKEYERTNDYEKGKVNPFEALPNEVVENNTSTEVNNNNNNNNQSNTGNISSGGNNETSGTTSQGNFLNTVK